MRCGFEILSVVNGTLNRAGKINVEQRTVDSMDDSNFARQDSSVSLVGTLGDLDVISIGMTTSCLYVTSI